MRHACVLLLAGAVAAQDAEPGPIPTAIVKVRRIRIIPRKGDARVALQTFVDAHRKHKAGDKKTAAKGYLWFLGMPGRHELPQRYQDTARRRLDALIDEARGAYEKACRLYRQDRAQGVAALQRVEKEYALLPQGDGARALWQTDRLRAAIDAARARRKTDTKRAAKELEKAVRQLADGLYRYEAKKLLIDLGGPDLFEKSEREGVEEKKPAGDKEEDEDVTIETGGDG